MASAFALLKEIEQRTLTKSAALAKLDVVKVEWRGLSFRVGATELLAPMVDIHEVLDPLPCTRIPRAKAWFHGVANVRGTLVPVMDLHSFLYEESLPVNNTTRTIVFKLPSSYVGLVVTAIGGLRHHYTDEQHAGAPEDLDERLARYIGKRFELREGVWGVFEIANLATTEEFLKISRTETA